MKKILNLLMIGLIAGGCSQQNNSSSTENAVNDSVAVLPEKEIVKAVPDTVTSLDGVDDSLVIYKDNAGNYYTVRQVAEEDADRSAMSKTSALPCDTQIFYGVARRDVKVTRLTKTYQTYANLVAMMATLPADSFMRNYNPPIKSDTNSLRVAEEKRNVTITTAWLYAIKREADNDFHLIVGTDTTPTASELFNMEVSGLPATTSTSYATLNTVRDTILNRFGRLCKTTYSVFSPPMKISIRGSLFYDIDHAPGVVGPLGYRPNTSWEVHPVTKIVFK